MSTGHVDYPHEPGYLIGCPACEERCHCEGTGNALCVYQHHLAEAADALNASRARHTEGEGS